MARDCTDRIPTRSVAHQVCVYHGWDLFELDLFLVWRAESPQPSQLSNYPTWLKFLISVLRYDT